MLGLDAVNVAIQPHHGHAVPGEDVVPGTALRIAQIALERQPIRLILLKNVLNILDSDVRLGLRIGADRQFAPGKEDVPILIFGVGKVVGVAFIALVWEEIERPEEQVLSLHLRFHPPQDGLLPAGIVA